MAKRKTTIPEPGSAFRFTEAQIADLPNPPAGQRHVYRDTVAPGLQIRVTANGVKTFSIFRRVKGGQPERVTLDRCPPMTVIQARAEAAKMNAAIAAGENPADVRRAVKGEPTFAEMFADYVKLHAKPRKRTWRGDEAMFNLHLAKAIGGRRVSQVTREQLAGIRDRITRSGAATAANRVLALVSSVYSWGIDRSRCDANPATGLRRNPEVRRKRFLLPNELPRFFAALREEPSATMRDYFLISLLTGARRGNVLAMRWADVDLTAAEWRIPRTKNDEPATIPLVPEAVAILRARKPDDDATWVFPGPGRHGHLAEPKKAWERVFDRDELTQLRARFATAGVPFADAEGEQLPTALRRARALAQETKIATNGVRIPDLRIHDLRRTLGSWQARQGASLAIIGASLAHKSQAATAIYARLDLDPVRESVERATSAILSAAGVKKPADVVELPVRAKGGS